MNPLRRSGSEHGKLLRTSERRDMRAEEEDRCYANERANRPENEKRKNRGSIHEEVAVYKHR